MRSAGDGVRLVIMDEPFRGLDRRHRHALLERARTVWRDATVLCVTHDISETQAFDRVLVLAAGRIVEDGNPIELAQQPGSAYAKLLEAERAVSELWSGPGWRALALDDGSLVEDPPQKVTRWTVLRALVACSDLGAALELLADATGLRPRSCGHAAPRLRPRSTRTPTRLGNWIEQASRQLGLEAEPAEIPYNAIEHHVRHAGPALLMVGARVVRSSWRSWKQAAVRRSFWPDGRRHRMRTSELAGVLRASLDAPLAPTIQTLLGEAGIAAARWPQAAGAILRDRFGSAPSRVLAPAAAAARAVPAAPSTGTADETRLDRGDGPRWPRVCVGDRMVDRGARGSRGTLRPAGRSSPGLSCS